VISDPTRKRLRRLCVEAVCTLEDLHEPVMRGQGAPTSEQRYRAIARDLGAAAKTLSRIADAIQRDLNVAARKARKTSAR
jgi:hypothetical protein